MTSRIPHTSCRASRLLSRGLLVLALGVLALRCGSGDAPTKPTPPPPPPPPPPPNGSLTASFLVRGGSHPEDSLTATLSANASGNERIHKLVIEASGALTEVDSQVVNGSAQASLTHQYVIPPLTAPDSVLLHAEAFGAERSVDTTVVVRVFEPDTFVVRQYTITPPRPLVRESVTVHLEARAATGISRVFLGIMNQGGRRFDFQGETAISIDTKLGVDGCPTDSLRFYAQVESGTVHTYSRTVIVPCWIPPSAFGFTSSADQNPILTPGDTLRILSIGAYQAGFAFEAPLTWVGYSVRSPINRRDSAAVTDTTQPWRHEFTITVDASWRVGSDFQLDTGVVVTTFARDSAGYINGGETDHPIKVVNATRYPTAFVPLQTRVVDAAFDAKRQRIYLSEPDSEQIAVLDVPTWRYLPPIAVNGGPWGLDLSVGGDSLVIVRSHTRTVVIIPLTGGASSSIDVPALPEEWLQHLRVLANNRAYVTTTFGGFGAGSIWEVNLANGTTRKRSDAGDNGDVTESGTIARSVSREKMLVFAADRCCPIDGQVFDAASDAFGPLTPVTNNDFAGQVSMSADGSRIVVGNRVWDASLSSSVIAMPQQYGTTPVDSPPSAISNDGTELYLAYPTGFFRNRSSDGSLIETVRLPLLYAPAHYDMSNVLMALPDGHTVIRISSQGITRTSLP